MPTSTRPPLGCSNKVMHAEPITFHQQSSPQTRPLVALKHTKNFSPRCGLSQDAPVPLNTAAGSGHTCTAPRGQPLPGISASWKRRWARGQQLSQSTTGLPSGLKEQMWPVFSLQVPGHV